MSKEEGNAHDKPSQVTLATRSLKRRGVELAVRGPELSSDGVFSASVSLVEEVTIPGGMGGAA